MSARSLTIDGHKLSGRGRLRETWLAFNGYQVAGCVIVLRHLGGIVTCFVARWAARPTQWLRVWRSAETIGWQVTAHATKSEAMAVSA